MLDIVDSLWIDHILTFTVPHQYILEGLNSKEDWFIYLSSIWLPGTFLKIYYVIIPNSSAI